MHLAKTRGNGGLPGTFTIDEMETFESDRRLKPVTVPVLIERLSYFVVHVETASLASRGNLGEKYKKRKVELEKREGKRKSGSRDAVLRTFEVLHKNVEGLIHLVTDRKKTYRSLAHQVFGEYFGSIARESSMTARTYGNVLFPINHTLAQMRDGVSRLVRRSWGAAKKRESLDRHISIWMAWRNYVRGITVRAPGATPAMALGVVDRRWSRQELLRWRVFSLPSVRLAPM